MALITLAVLGGSGVATPELLNALRRWPATSRPELRVVLLGRTSAKLDRVRETCASLVADAQPLIRVEATTDWRGGLTGVDLVLNQVRVGGLESRAHDETFPRALGFPGEETIGPGGFANALRTLPVVLEALRIIEEVAPQALVLNLTNPAGLVQQMAQRYTRAQVVSLCDSPITLGDQLATLLARPRSELVAGYLGMNHLGWFISLQDLQGQDLLEEVLLHIEDLPTLGADPAYIRASRAIPLPYNRYYLQPEQALRQQEGRAPRAHQLLALERELLSSYANPASETEVGSAVARRGAVWYDAIIVPILDALFSAHGSAWIVNVRNGELVPWLPAETVIEAPAHIDRQGIRPLPLASQLLAPELRSLLFAQATYESLAAQAIIEHSRDLAWRALVAHPLIRTLEAADRVLEAVWPQAQPKGCADV